jgi:hypothetical protein
MIDRSHDLPLTRQAALLKLSRSSVYYRPRPVSPADLAIMRRIDELHLDYPFADSRMPRDLLHDEGVEIGRQHVITLMRRMGIKAIYRRPNTSRARGHGAITSSSSGCGARSNTRRSTCAPTTVSARRARRSVDTGVLQPQATALEP